MTFYKVEIIDPELKKAYKQARKNKLKAKFQNGLEWIVDNKELVIYLAPVIIGATTTIVKVAGRSYNNHKAEAIKNLYCYDRSLGHYWKLKRELTNREWLEIDARKKNGERLADILSEMKVLK